MKDRGIDAVLTERHSPLLRRISFYSLRSNGISFTNWLCS